MDMTILEGRGKGGRRGERGEGGGKRANISGLLNFATASPRTSSEIHSSIKFQSNNTSEYIYLNICSVILSHLTLDLCNSQRYCTLYISSDKSLNMDVKR
jgi:hypothetical protein